MFKRSLAAVMAIAMFLSLVPDSIFPVYAAGPVAYSDGASEVMQNTNWQDGA